MASQLDLAIRLVNEASKTLKEIDADMGGLEKSTGRLDGALSKAGSVAKGFGSAIGDVAKVAGGFVMAQGIMQAPGFLMDAAKAAAEDEQATMRLEQALRNSGGAFDESLAKVNDRIAAGQKLAFSDDDVRDSFQSLLAATGDTDEALKRQAAAMDLARGAGIPLEAATRMLGKINGENVEVFKKMGIVLGENATEADALAAVQAKFGGQAQTYANSTAGQFEIAKIKMAEVKETIGGALLPIMAKLGTVLVDDVMPKVEQFVAWVMPKLSALGDWLNTNVMPVIAQAWDVFQKDILPKLQEFADTAKVKLGEFMDWLKPQFEKFQVYYKEDIKPAMDNIQAAFEWAVGWIRDHWPEIEAIVRPIMEQVANAIESSVRIIKDVLNIVIQLLGGDWKGAWEGAKQLIADVWNYITNTFNNGVQFLRGLGGVFFDVAKGLGNAIKDGFINGIKGALGLANTIANAVIGLMEGAINSMIQLVNDAIPNQIGPILGVSYDLPDNPIPSVTLPRLAKGGIVTQPTIALIGEAGPEAVVPLSGANARQVGGITVQINAPIYGVDDFIYTLDRALKRAGQPGLVTA